MYLINNVTRQYSHEPEVAMQAQELAQRYEDMEELEVPAFSDDMSKQEMIDHLVEYHGCLGRRIAGKEVFRDRTGATKGELLAYHDRAHQALENPNTEIEYYNRVYLRDDEGKIQKNERGRIRYTYNFSIGGFPVPKIRHRHAAVVLSEKQMSAVNAVRSNERAAAGVLNVRDRKVLTELVNNDFNALKQEMRAFAADSLAQKVREVNEDWDEREKKIPDFAGSATELHRQHETEKVELRRKQEEEQRKLREKQEDAFKKITDKAEAKGVSLKPETRRVLAEDGQTWVNRIVYVASVQGRKDAIAGVERENKSFLDRALMTLEKQRLTAQRQVLLSGVPQEAMPIVESIPDAKALMVKAQEESNAKQLN